MSISSRYLSLQPSYYIDLNEGHEEISDQHQMIVNHTTPFSYSSLQPYHNTSSLSSSSSTSSPNYLKPVQDQAGFCYMGSQIQPYSCQQEVENLRSYGSGSHDQTTLEINKRANNGLKFSIWKKEDKSFSAGYGGDCGGSSTGEINGSSVKWMSSKMRLMKKMMKNEEDQRAEADNRVGNSLVIKSSNNGSSNNNNNNENVTIRTCSDCNTTKTPLWRSGPRGPKSLCNACGIRQRKARRAAMAAATGNGSMLPINPSSSMIRTGNNKKTPVNNNGFGTQKKRSKTAKPSRDQHNHNDSQRKLCFEEFALSLSKKLSIQQVFPQEEKEAAILLMALSCGLVHG